MEVTVEAMRKRAEQLSNQVKVYSERALMARGAAEMCMAVAASLEKAAEIKEKTDA